MEKLYTDGACRKNGSAEAVAGAGIVIYDKDGNIVREFGQYIGHSTNNIAEYTSLIIGLGEVIRLGIKKIEIFMDSKLVCEQVKGNWKIKSIGLKPLHSSVLDQLKKLDFWTLTHIPRELNKRADKMANDAIDYTTQVD